MITFFKKLGFRRNDELNDAINQKAIKASWLFLMLTMAGTYAYEYIKDGSVSFLPGFALPLSLSIFFTTQLWYTHRYTKDEQGKSEFVNWKLILISFVIFFVLILIPMLYFIL